VRSWRFEPAALQGIPVRVVAQAPVSFCIHRSCAPKRVTLVPTAAVLALIGIRGGRPGTSSSGTTNGPRLLEWTRPTYPEDARLLDVEGAVVRSW
jgi:hypothetical protein